MTPRTRRWTLLPLLSMALACERPPPGVQPRAAPAADLPVADMIITLAHAPRTGEVGQVVDVGARVENIGPDDAPESTITFELPTGLTYQGASELTGPCTQSGRSISCPIGPVPKGSESRPSILVVPEAPGTFVVSATLFSLKVSDPFSGNNTGEETIPVVLPGQADVADLLLSPAPGPEGARAGKAFTFGFVVDNRGPSTARDVLLEATIDGPYEARGLTVKGATCDVNAPGIFCRLGDLPANTVRQVDATLTPTAGGVLAIQGEAKTDLVEDPVPGDNSFGLEVPVQGIGAEGVDLSLDLSADPAVIETGGRLTLSATVKNDGGDDATNVLLGVPLPTALVAVDLDPDGPCSTSPGRLTCELASLPSASATTFTADLLGQGEGTFTLSGYVSSAVTDAFPSDDGDDLDVAVVAPGTTALADLGLTAQASDAPRAGAALVLSFHITNTGPSDATGVVLSASMPPEPDVISGDLDGQACEIGAGALRCELDALPAGGAVLGTLVVVPEEAGLFFVDAHVAGSELDPAPSNDHIYMDIPIDESEAPPVVDLALAAAPLSATPLVGDTLTWVVTITNQGPDLASTAEVVFDLPAAATVSASAAPGSCGLSDGRLRCPAGFLGADASAEASITLLPTAAGPLTLSARATTLETDGQPENDRLAVALDVGPAPRPAITASGGEVSATEATPGAARVAVLPFSLGIGEREGVSISYLTVRAEGSGLDHLDLAAVEIYADGDGDGAPDGGASAMASGRFGVDDGALLLPLRAPLDLPAGASVRLVLTVDVREELQSAVLPAALLLVLLVGSLGGRRRPGRLLALGAALGLSCGGGAPAPPEDLRTYTLSLEAVGATGEDHGEAAEVDGLPLEGATLTVDARL